MLISSRYEFVLPQSASKLTAGVSAAQPDNGAGAGYQGSTQLHPVVIEARSALINGFEDAPDGRRRRPSGAVLGLATDPPLGPKIQSAVVVEAVPDVIRNAVCAPEERCPSDVDELETLEDVS